MLISNEEKGPKDGPRYFEVEDNQSGITLL
jgi:hypothetical protein